MVPVWCQLTSVRSSIFLLWRTAESGAHDPTERARIEAKSLFTKLKREGDPEDALDIARRAWEHYSEDKPQIPLSGIEALLPS
jgi:hypothetical protein